MKQNNGWIKQYRSTLENPVVMKSSAHFAVWNLLLLMANTYPKQVMFNGEQMILQPGQLITGRKEVNNKLPDLNESKVERILKSLENAHQIEQRKTNKGRLITILNWDKYQKGEQRIEQQVNNKRTTSEQQNPKKRTLIKNNKNIKKIKNNKNIHSAKTECESVLKLYNSICTNLPRAIKLTDSRAEGIQRALVEGVDFKAVFEKVNSSDFLTGKKTGWSGCNLDWILQPENLLKIQEGCYKTYQQDNGYSFNGQAQYSDSDKNNEYIELFESKSLFKD